MKRVLLPMLLMLAVILISVACYIGAQIFHKQYIHAHNLVTNELRVEENTISKSLNGFDNPERYFLRVRLMALASVMVWVGTVTAAISYCRWYVWLSVIAVTVFTVATLSYIFIRV
jgi:hypothetical protein